jgi:hypothetical protein
MPLNRSRFSGNLRVTERRAGVRKDAVPTGLHKTVTECVDKPVGHEPGLSLHPNVNDDGDTTTAIENSPTDDDLTISGNVPTTRFAT